MNTTIFFVSFSKYEARMLAKTFSQNLKKMSGYTKALTKQIYVNCRILPNDYLFVNFNLPYLMAVRYYNLFIYLFEKLTFNGKTEKLPSTRQQI